MCFQERKKPALIVTILSVIVILLGILMVIESGIYYTHGSILTTDLGTITEKVKTFRSSTFGVLMAFSCSAILVGAFGVGCFCKPCKEKIALPIIYGIFLFFVWVIILVIGIVVTGISYSSPEAIQSFCTGTTGNSRLGFIADQIDSIDVSINNYADQFMCSYVCPCDNSNSAPWKALNETYLNSHNRTSVAGTNYTDAKGFYRFYWTNLTATPNATTYATFTQCHNYLQSNQAARTSNMPDSKAIDTGIKILTYFESKYTCSGICNPGLFYWSLNIDRGLPATNCLGYLKQEIGNNMNYLGVTAIVVGGILFFIWIFQYCLWKRFPQEDKGYGYSGK